MQFQKLKTTNVDEETPYWMSFFRHHVRPARHLYYGLGDPDPAADGDPKELEHKQAKFEEEIVALKQAEQVRRTILTKL